MKHNMITMSEGANIQYLGAKLTVEYIIIKTQKLKQSYSTRLSK